MRLIDADAFLKEYCEPYPHIYQAMGSAFKHAQTVDAVPVIRCRDCIYWKKYCRIVDGVTSNHVCGRKREFDGAMHRSKADDFCSWAERRNDETD